MLVIFGFALFSLLVLSFYAGGSFNCQSCWEKNTLKISGEVFDHKLKTGKHLVIVPGFGTLKINPSSDIDIENIKNWKIRSELLFPLIQSQVEKAAEIGLSDPDAVVSFSGGQTNEQIPISEAFSYYLLLLKRTSNGKGSSELPFGRFILEEYARDSFENVLFSLCRFMEVTGYFPDKVTVIGLEFKRDRFMKLHLPAVDFDLQKVKYIGIDSMQPSTNSQTYRDWYKETRIGEYHNAYKLFKGDPYGCHGSLSQKKESRDPFQRHEGRLGYKKICPNLERFMCF